MYNMVFIGGVHGVGKTYFCESLCKKYHLVSYSASQLISRKSNKQFTSDKKVRNISDNQNLLLDAIKELALGNEWFLLDGHFCLINKDGTVERIRESTFHNLRPRGIIVLVDSVERILERVKTRDGIVMDFDFVEQFQIEELTYSKEVAMRLNVPYLVHGIDDSLEKVDEFFRHMVSGS
jgi:adenylate kinase